MLFVSFKKAIQGSESDNDDEFLKVREKTSEEKVIKYLIICLLKFPWQWMHFQELKPTKFTLWTEKIKSHLQNERDAKKSLHCFLWASNPYLLTPCKYPLVT